MNLTFKANVYYALPTATQLAVWDWSLSTKGVNRLNAVFLCVKYQFIIMLGCARLSSEGLVSFVPVDQPCSVRLHDWSHVVGFKNLTKGDYHV